MGAYEDDAPDEPECECGHLYLDHFDITTEIVGDGGPCIWCSCQEFVFPEEDAA